MRGNGIHQPFAHEGALEPAGRAIGAARRLVGQADMRRRRDRPARDRAPAAWRRRDRAPSPRGCAHRRPGRERISSSMREDAPVAIDRGADAMLLLARMIGGDQVLAAILDPFHRPPQAQRGDADQHVLGIELAADAEAAADMALHKGAPTTGRGRACARSGLGSNAAPWRRRAIRARRGRRHSARSRRGSRAARRNGGRSTASASTTACALRNAASTSPYPLRTIAGFGRAAGLEFAGRLVGLQQRPAAPRCRARPARRHPRRDRDRPRTPRRPARRHNAHDPSARSALAIRLQARRCGSGENRSAECRRRPRRSTPHARPAARSAALGVDRAQPAVRVCRAHDAHVQLVGK